MSRLVDLSHVLRDGSPHYPGDEPFRLVQRKSVSEDGFTSFLLKSGFHVGTHLDAPLHFLEEGAMVQDLPLATFIGRGVLLDVRGQSLLGPKVEYGSLVTRGDIVLLWSDWSTTYGTDAYYTEHPTLHEGLADFLIERGVKLLGLDFPSPDTAPFAIHKKLLDAGIPIIENLTNLAELAPARAFDVMAFPLKIRAEGSPVRVVAQINN
ncbi:MAG: cyclase family protein [Bacillota bacterium]|jgi:kynurenine formamidase|nr:cyclase family protein [Bacillota bacterium]HHT90755.1 cyclase family protein [Bacillota bacterium]